MKHLRRLAGLTFSVLQLPLLAISSETAHAQSQSDRLEALIRAQAAQIEELRREVQAMKNGQLKPPQRVSPATSEAGKTPPAPRDGEKTAPVPREAVTQVATAPPARTPGAMGSPQHPMNVQAGDKKLTWKLPGSDVSLRIGGYTKLDVIGIAGGDRSVGSSDLFNPVALQTRGVATGTAPGDPGTRIHARQSRLFVEASKADTPFGPARAYVEGDFFGPIDLGTETTSNSSTFRLRHAFGEVGPILAGQYWTTFSDPATYPEILDFQGPGAQSFVRQAQLRYTQNFGGGFTGAVSIENPESRIRIGAGPVTGTGTAASATGIQNIGVGPFARDRLPDFIARVRYDSPQFNLQLSGVATRSTSPLPIGATPVAGGDGNLGYGVLATGQIALPLLGDKDNFRFQTGYIDGAARYMQDVAGSSPSFAYNATLTQYDSVKAYGGFGAFQHWWTNTIRSSFVYNYVHIDNPNYSGPAVVAATRYGVANLLWSPWTEVDVGIEVQYGQRIDADGSKANQTRVQSSFIYRF